MFTQKQLDVLFHILNNSYGDCWEQAAERAATDGMDREEFCATHAQCLRILTNAEGA